MEQKVFDDIKRYVAHNNFLSYPDFSKRFDIHSDAREYQLRPVIRQSVSVKLITLSSRKPTRPQMWYTVLENELLSIVETLKEFFTRFY